MSGKRIGYVRVSTIDQNPERQLENIELDKKFIDYASASSTDRPQLKAMLDYAREDDIIIVHSMDRLCRNVFDLKKIANELVSRQIQIKFIKENITIDGQQNAMSNLMLSLMGAFAEFELAYIRERQMQGIQIAKQKGIYKGRKSKFTEEMKQQIEHKMTASRDQKSKIAKELGISRNTLYKYLSRIEIEKNNK